MHRYIRSAALAAVLWAGAVAQAATAETFETSVGPIEVSAEVSGLNRPWSFAFLPDGAILLTEKPGTLRLWDGALSQPISGVPEILARGQGGLLDIALSADFEQSGEIYLSYSAAVPGGAQTRVARAVFDRSARALRDVTVIFRQEPAQNTLRHFGSRIVVAPDGSLFITVGDRAQRDQAQNTESHQGSVIRIMRSGAPHPQNPFLDGGGRPELFSYGHRNPQGAAWAHGTLWTVEHGPAGGDEINRPVAGRNYGWPRISYGVHYSGARIGVGTRAEGMEQPAHFWDPSIAPSGMAVVTGAVFPEWEVTFSSVRSSTSACRALTFRMGRSSERKSCFRGFSAGFAMSAWALSEQSGSLPMMRTARFIGCPVRNDARNDARARRWQPGCNRARG